MKPLFTFSFLLLLFTASSYATIHNVAVSSYQFSPSSFSAEVGDTIIWTVSGSIPHTTTSTEVPIGANTWDHPFSGSGDTYSYVITIPGNYNYYCFYHGVSNGMTGSFTATSTQTGVQNVNQLQALQPLNPFTGMVRVYYDRPGTVEIFNVLGAKMAEQKISNTNSVTTINFPTLPQGVYIVALMNEGTLVETRKVVRQ